MVLRTNEASVHRSLEHKNAAIWSLPLLDHLERYRSELDSLMREEFHILKDEDLPLDPAA